WDLGRPECRRKSAPADCLVNSQQAATPCRFEACDPRVPYRVLEHSVRYLTLESEQGPAGTDLNGDGDTDDLVVQMLNLRQGAAPAPQVLAAAAAGLCKGSGESCVTGTDCRQGPCLVPPSGCTREIGIDCTPGMADECAAAGWSCRPRPGGGGTCV